MPWVRLDDAMLSHQKFDRIGKSALGFWLRGLLFAARNLTDGKIPERFARGKSERGLAADLVSRELWDAVEGGWMIHGYLNWQPSKQDVERRRALKRERQNRWMDRRDRNGDAPENVLDASETAPRPYPLSLPKEQKELSTMSGVKEIREATKVLAEKLTMPNAGFVRREREK